jgi:hypothetical protein
MMGEREPPGNKPVPRTLPAFRWVTVRLDTIPVMVTVAVLLLIVAMLIPDVTGRLIVRVLAVVYTGIVVMRWAVRRHLGAPSPLEMEGISAHVRKRHRDAER